MSRRRLSEADKDRLLFLFMIVWTPSVLTFIFYLSLNQ